MGEAASGTDGVAGSVAPRLSAADVARARLGDRVLRFEPGFVVAVAVGCVAVGQFAEDLADSAPIQMMTPTSSAPRWTVVLAVLYILVILPLVARTIRRSLPALESVVRIDDAAFQAYARRMAPPSTRVTLAILAISALTVTLLFPVMQSDLPIADPVTHGRRYLPADVLQAVVILAGYTVVGWAFWMLVTRTVRLGRALGALSREPIDVDVFDTSNVVPFGNIALAVALAPAGVILIFLLGLGQPSSWLSWAIVLLAASASLLALLLPLRGIHHQMSMAKLAALANLNVRIGQAYNEATGPTLDPSRLAPLNMRTNTLVPLRHTVQEMTTWPFRNTVAFGRAVLIASAPLIYTALGELIKVLWIAPLTKGP